MATALRRRRIDAPSQESLALELIEAGIERAAGDGAIDRVFEVASDVRRVRSVAKLENRQHDGLLELAENDLGRHERVWK
jgi:hypothetical protein